MGLGRNLRATLHARKTPNPMTRSATAVVFDSLTDGA
jgi:hypothetical protein